MSDLLNFALIGLGVFLGYQILNTNPTTESFTNVSLDGSMITKLNDGSLQLTSSKNYNGVLVTIRADWCGYCRELKKNIDVAMKIKPFTVLNFDATDNKNPKVSSVLKLLNVSSFPTLFKVSSNNILVPYTGSRNPSDLAKNFS